MSFTPYQAVLIFSSALAVSHTGDTALTTVYTNTLKANTMRSNDQLEIEVMWSYTNSANNKTCTIQLGGTNLLNISVTTTATFQRIIYLLNRNSLSSQVYSSSAGFVTYSTAGARATSSLNFGTDLTFNVKVTLANSGEAIQMERIVAKLSRSAI